MQKIWKENSEEDWKAKKMSKTMNIVKNCVKLNTMDLVIYMITV